MLFGRHIVEINATNNTLVRSYVWGLDLSRTMDGAGGVGGLAWVKLHTASGPASWTHFVCYDGNGNIVSLVSATTGDVTARYEYGPFGEPICITSPAASLNPFRFSTKRTENNTDLVLYENRAYSPSLGRWTSHDPIDYYQRQNEWLVRVSTIARVGVSQNVVCLYHYVFNSPIGMIDPNGQEPREGDSCCAKECKLFTELKFVSISPDCNGGGCSFKQATGWHIKVRVTYQIKSGVCHIIGCKYWTCNLGIPKIKEEGWILGACDGWTYDMAGDPDNFPDDGYHAKAMGGRVEYLSCENGRWTKKALSENGLHFGLYYRPPKLIWIIRRSIHKLFKIL
jgi:RHS repeat-associated protein